MGYGSSTEFNIVSPENSVNGLTLGANAFFNGSYVDVSEFTTITMSAAGTLPPAVSDGLQMQWSHDGTTLFSQTIFGSDLNTFQTVHATIRAKFARVRYHAGTSGQTNLSVQTLLRKGTVAGSVSPVGIITGTPDAQIVNSLMFGKTSSGLFMPVQVVSDPNTPTNFNLVMSPPESRSNAAVTLVTATLSSAQINFNTLEDDRRAMTVFNNTDRGNLYIKWNTAATTAVYDWKVPPQHTFHMPYSWIPQSGDVFGVWDFADGNAHVLEFV